MNINSIRSTPQPIKESQYKRPDVPAQNESLEKSVVRTELKRTVKHSADTESKISQNADVLSPKEKEFFIKMFPDAENEIQSYGSYKRDGSRSSVQLGAVIDRKG